MRNAFTYPSIGGYDAQEYITYARDLVEHRMLPPEGVGAYYTPPGYMALAGIAGSIASPRSPRSRSPRSARQRHRGRRDRGHRPAARADVVAGAAVTWVASVGFFAFLPTVLKTGAMFHPEPLGMLVTAGALLVLARMVRTRTYSWTLAVALGLLLGAGQLVRAWSLWMVGVAVVVLVAAALVIALVRRAALVAALVAVVLAVVVPAPWYVHQATQYSNPVFDRPQEDEFLLARRPLAVLRRRRLRRRRASAVAGSFQRSVSPGPLRRDVGRLLRYLVLGAGSR